MEATTSATEAKSQLAQDLGGFPFEIDCLPEPAFSKPRLCAWNGGEFHPAKPPLSRAITARDF